MKKKDLDEGDYQFAIECSGNHGIYMQLALGVIQVIDFLKIYNEGIITMKCFDQLNNEGLQLSVKYGAAKLYKDYLETLEKIVKPDFLEMIENITSVDLNNLSLGFRFILAGLSKRHEGRIISGATKIDKATIEDLMLSLAARLRLCFWIGQNLNDPNEGYIIQASEGCPAIADQYINYQNVREDCAGCPQILYFYTNQEYCLLVPKDISQIFIDRKSILSSFIDKITENLLLFDDEKLVCYLIRAENCFHKDSEISIKRSNISANPQKKCIKCDGKYENQGIYLISCKKGCKLCGYCRKYNIGDSNTCYVCERQYNREEIELLSTLPNFSSIAE